jgi:hypothetical protein
MMGVKSMKGVGEIYSEVKQAVSVGLTPTAKKGLDALAAKMNLSRSELVEQIGRGRLLVVKADSE